MHLFAFSVAALIGYSGRMQDDNWTPSFKHLNFIYVFSANRGKKAYLSLKMAFWMVYGIQRASIQNIEFLCLFKLCK